MAVYFRSTRVVWLFILAGNCKILSESFDMAQDERRRFVSVHNFPFMLRISKHSEPLYDTLLAQGGDFENSSLRDFLVRFELIQDRDLVEFEWRR